MIIREWKRSDNDAITLIDAKCFHDPWNKRMFDDCFDTGVSFVGMVAEEEGRLLGYVGAVYVFGAADIVNICVDTPFRRRGIAEQLLGAVIDDLSVCGVSKFFLEVRRSNAAAIALYEKLGFKKLGERKKYYENTEDALIYGLTR